MATHVSILAWTVPTTRSLASYSPQGCKESDTIEHSHTHRLNIGGFPGGSVIKTPSANQETQV